MFPSKLSNNNREYYLVRKSLSEYELKELLLLNPYDVYAVVNESLDDKGVTMFTTFLVLHAIDFENRVILYDVSRQQHSTITTELCFLAKGYIEFIDVGQVDRYPIRFYIREDNKNENI
ncbi:hypothetical protein [Bacillus sp. ISL-7]|uniref:hypothetical protein n=1 Tax=Bacillus sp. ISL-7 TaxID=2819136 RepID=UPI001BEA5B97|nr:hypothetical protein [Bacillus sp. ISL-7]MBT2736192.1 hypothetical protein [Bacillus sp. ISL-7]